VPATDEAATEAAAAAPSGETGETVTEEAAEAPAEETAEAQS